MMDNVLLNTVAAKNRAAYNEIIDKGYVAYECFSKNYDAVAMIQNVETVCFSNDNPLLLMKLGFESAGALTLWEAGYLTIIGEKWHDTEISFEGI